MNARLVVVCALVIVCASSVAACAADNPPAAPSSLVKPSTTFAQTELDRPPRVVDRKFVLAMAIGTGLTIADIEVTQHCLQNHTCYELNPLIPRSRAGMYAANIPLNAAAYYLSYRLKSSGRKSWWIAPLGIIGAHGIGAGITF